MIGRVPLLDSFAPSSLPFDTGPEVKTELLLAPSFAFSASLLVTGVLLSIELLL